MGGGVGQVWRPAAAAAANIDWRLTGGGAHQGRGRRRPPLCVVKALCWARGPRGSAAGSGRRYRH